MFVGCALTIGLRPQANAARINHVRLASVRIAPTGPRVLSWNVPEVTACATADPMDRHVIDFPKDIGLRALNLRHRTIHQMGPTSLQTIHVTC
jgi:hypothetical protein